MGIFDIIRKTRDKDNKTDVVDKPEQKIEDKQEFVSDLSYLELQNADWVSFAGILKREGVLSNSYDKKPASIEYSFRNYYFTFSNFDWILLVCENFNTLAYSFSMRLFIFTFLFFLEFVEKTENLTQREKF